MDGHYYCCEFETVGFIDILFVHRKVVPILVTFYILLTYVLVLEASRSMSCGERSGMLRVLDSL